MSSKRTKKAPLAAEQLPHQDDAQVEHQEQPQDDQHQLPHQDAQEQPQEQEKPKRGRGRPRKPVDPNAPPKPKGQSASKLPLMVKDGTRTKRGRPTCLEAYPQFLTTLKENLGDRPPHQILWEGLQAGLPPALACQAAGISSKTWYGYEERAKTDPDCPQDMKEFVEACQIARARKAIEVQQAMIAVAMGEQKGWWQALATWLERQFPEHYGQAQRPKETPPAVNVTINNAESEAAKAAEDLMRQAEAYRQWKLTQQPQAALTSALPDEDEDD